MEVKTTVEARVESVHADNGARGPVRIGYRARIVIHHGYNEQGKKDAPLVRTDISEAWRDARIMREHELTKRALPIT